MVDSEHTLEFAYSYFLYEKLNEKFLLKSTKDDTGNSLEFWDVDPKKWRQKSPKQFRDGE